MLRPDNFSDYCWHDNAIHGFRIAAGEDGGGVLDFDIDFILDWLAPVGGGKSYMFKIAPATLTFLDITDLVISIDYVSCTAAITPPTIDEIVRESISFQNGYTSFSWRIKIAWPCNSFISFRSPGFTQALRGDPIVSELQYLAPELRPPL